MGALNHLLFLSLLFPLISSENICPPTSCDKSNFEIKFPFGIKNLQHQNCTYPGFELNCTKQGLTSINLSGSGEFLVRHIDYQTREIFVYDPNSCLAKMLLHFDPANSPFLSLHYVELIFLTCPTKLSLTSNYTVIDCLSNSINTTFAATHLDIAAETRACDIMGTSLIPTSRDEPYDNNIVSNLFNTDLILKWDVPMCMECETMGTNCGFIADSAKVVCLYDYEPGTGKHNQQKIYRIVSIAIAIPAIACVFAFALFVRCIAYRQLSVDHSFTIQEIALEPTTTTVRGLDESTIESYTKVTLGESKRLPGTGDGTCAICLSEFCFNEIVKVIPECRHCFHATCIDEWLRIRSTCPVCRNSPNS